MNNEQFRHWRQNYTRQSSVMLMPLVMGIVNVTPDSFSDGGQYFHFGHALNHAKKLIADGADILDIGGESSRPGAVAVSVDEEIERVIPLIHRLHAEEEICLSIDTSKAQVMRAAIDSGAGMINDISGLAEQESLLVAAQSQLPLCLMHRQGTPLTMQQNPLYDTDVLDEINDFFRQKIECCLAAGVLAENLILDPGFGFGKTVAHNLKIIKRLHQFERLQLPVMVGVSRKSTLGAIVNKPVNERLAGGIAASVMAMMQGAAIIRTHDVAETKQALLVAQAIRLADND